MTQTTYEAKSVTDIAYAVNDDAHERRRLDIYSPKDNGHFPVLMFVSGGGWIQSSKAWIANVGQTLASMGLVVVTVDHRLIPEVEYDGMVNDLALAFAWVKEHILAFNGNPKQVFVGGLSAGGHLMTLLATNHSYLDAVGYTTEDVAGVVSVSVLFEVNVSHLDDILEAVDSSNPQSSPLKRFATSDDEYADASPRNHIRDDLPPFLIMYAEDELIDAIANQAESMAESLRTAQIPVELVRISERNHFTIGSDIGTIGDNVAPIVHNWIMTHASRETGEWPTHQM